MKKSLALFLLFALLLTAGCSNKDNAKSKQAEQNTANSEVIKIGVFQPLSGANAGGGQLELEGSQLANQLYPEVLGKKIELVVVDNKSSKVEATRAVEKLIKDEKVVAIIGSWGSGLSMAVGDTIQKYQVPTVGGSCTNPLVTANNNYYFRVCFIDPFQGLIMANFAEKSLNAKKAAIMQEISSDYSVGLANYFVNSFIKLTNDEHCIVATANYNTGDTDFSDQLKTIIQAKPDVIFAPGNFTESAMFIKQARNLGCTIPIIGGDTWETDEFLQVGGKQVEGSTFSTFFDDGTPLTSEAEKFIAAYHAKYPNKTVSPFAALGYDAYLLIYQGIIDANSTAPNAIRDAIAAIQNLEGATGDISLDSNGDAIKNLAVIKTVKNGAFAFKESITLN